MSKQTALYRWFDGGGVLLYVGISHNVAQRAKEHEREKAWWSQVASCSAEHFDTRAEALEAERIAIIEERPRYNIVHSARRSGRRPASGRGYQLTWRCDFCGDSIIPLKAGYMQSFTNDPQRTWHVVCKHCDDVQFPGEPSAYWFSLDRANTRARLDSWVAHLLPKLWVDAAEIVRIYEDVMRWNGIPWSRDEFPSSVGSARRQRGRRAA